MLPTSFLEMSIETQVPVPNPTCGFKREFQKEGYSE
jgi:hypothetical protein